LKTEDIGALVSTSSFPTQGKFKQKDNKITDQNSFITLTDTMKIVVYLGKKLVVVFYHHQFCV
jgi:hypothetical protein